MHSNGEQNQESLVGVGPLRLPEAKIRLITARGLGSENRPGRRERAGGRFVRGSERARFGKARGRKGLSAREIRLRELDLAMAEVDLHRVVEHLLEGQVATPT